MNTKDFYILNSKLLSSTIQVHCFSLSQKQDVNGLFEEHKLIQGVYDNITFPVLFKQEYGNKLADILDTGWSSLYLISDKMKTLLENNLLTGWKTFPVKVSSKEGKEIEGFHGFSITGRCGLVDFTKAETITKELVPGGPMGEFNKGLYFDIEAWDKSDFFIPENYFGIIVSKKASEILSNSNLSNINLLNLLDVEIMKVV